MHSLAFPLVTPAPKLCCPTLSNVFESWSGVTHIYSLFVCSTFSYVTHCYRRIIHQAHFNQISPREFLKNYEMTCLENRKSCVGLSTNWYRFDFFFGGGGFVTLFCLPLLCRPLIPFLIASLAVRLISFIFGPYYTTSQVLQMSYFPQRLEEGTAIRLKTRNARCRFIYLLFEPFWNPLKIR